MLRLRNLHANCWTDVYTCSQARWWNAKQHIELLFRWLGGTVADRRCSAPRGFALFLAVRFGSAYSSKGRRAGTCSKMALCLSFKAEMLTFYISFARLETLKAIFGRDGCIRWNFCPLMLCLIISQAAGCPTKYAVAKGNHEHD